MAGSASRQSWLGAKFPQALLGLLALAALAFGAFIPPGHMLSKGGALGFSVSICPSTHPLGRMAEQKSRQAALTLHGDMTHGDKDHLGHHMPQEQVGHGDQADHAGHDGLGPSSSDCDQGVGNLKAPVPTMAMLKAVHRESVEQFYRILRSLALAERPRLRPPLRGPPLFN